MKTIATSVCTALLALFPFVAGQPATAWSAGPEWVRVDMNDESVFSYDKAGITTPRKGMLRVTTQVVYTEKGKAQTRASLKPAEAYEKLAETRFVIEIDCSHQKSKLLRVTHLDQAGKELKAFDLEGVTDWEDIPRDARMEQITDWECRR